MSLLNPLSAELALRGLDVPLSSFEAYQAGINIGSDRYSGWHTDWSKTFGKLPRRRNR
jgi:hypothetical protein